MWSILKIAEFIQTKYGRLHNEDIRERFNTFTMTPKIRRYQKKGRIPYNKWIIIDFQEYVTHILRGEKEKEKD
jgi:hypothetical protein